MEAQGSRIHNRAYRGNGRSRGRGRGRGIGRGRGKRSSGLEPCESSSSDSDDDVQEVLVEKLDGPDEVRRSMRARKPVNYTVNHFEADDADKSSDQCDEKYSDEEAIEQDISSAQVVCGDAAPSHNEKKQPNAGHPALDECLHGDYLEMGSGFCTDKCEIGQPDVSQHGEPSVEAEFSKDYLKMGGGFCSGEGEPENDQDGAPGPAPATASGNADLSHLPGFMDEADIDDSSLHSNLGSKGALNELQDGEKIDAYDTASNVLNTSSNDGNSKGQGSLQENTKDDTGTTSLGGLSAMPFLRRKRRKS